MFTLQRLRQFVAALRPFRSRLPFPTTLAGYVVLLAYLGSLVLLLVFVGRHVSRVPYLDEYATFRFLFGEAGTRPSEYWVQHNEHRIPLPQALYVGVVRLSGYDFRTPVFVNSALLAFVAAYLLWVVRRVRGRFSVADAFLPLTVLGLGGWENLLWGFQIQFVLSTVLLLVFLGLVLVPGFATSTRRLAAASVIVSLLPLCGANGVALVPALALGLLIVGVRNLRSRRRAGLIALLGALAALAVLAAYFHGLKKIGHHPPPPSPEVVVSAAINVLGLSLGPVTHLMHTPGYDRITVTGGAVFALVALTGVLLLRSLRDSEQRPRALLVGSILGGLFCLAAGLAYGRAGFGNILGASRYITLAMPIPVAAYLAWVAFGRGVAGRIVPFVLLAVTVACIIPNTRYAFAAGGLHSFRQKRVEYDIKAGIPLGFIAERNSTVFPGTLAAFRTSLELLRDHGAKPFTALRPDPELMAEPVPLRILRVEGMTEENGYFCVIDKPGSVVFALPRRQHVYAYELTYEGRSRSSDFPAFLSWDRDGRVPATNGYGIIHHFMGTGRTTTRIYVDRETDLLRIDLLSTDDRIRIHSLAVLTPTR